MLECQKMQQPPQVRADKEKGHSIVYNNLAFLNSTSSWLLVMLMLTVFKKDILWECESFNAIWPKLNKYD
jgi:hypothetical protein